VPLGDGSNRTCHATAIDGLAQDVCRSDYQQMNPVLEAGDARIGG
jgi:hypothetical protein